MLLVGGIAGYFLIKERNNSQSETIPTEIKPIYDLVRSCIEETGYNAFYDLGTTGGYYFPPNKTTSAGIVYYLNGKISIPTSQEFEKQISYYIQDNLKDCILDFANFQESNITYGTIKVQTKLVKDRAEIYVIWPISIRTQKDSYNLEKFSADLPNPFNRLQEAAKEIVNLFYNDPSSMCINCIQDLEVKYKVDISTMERSNDTIIFRITDLNGVIPSKLQFAIK
jgi:hypothetical protein